MIQFVIGLILLYILQFISAVLFGGYPGGPLGMGY